jgi:hypothetical protein
VTISDQGLQISGILDSVNIHETDLWVQDHLIFLSAESNNQFVEDGQANEGAGLRINGNPYGVDSNNSLAYRKSFTWHNSTSGIPALGTTHAASSESFWELMGGHFRLTYVKDDTGKRVSYALRVNQNDELEFVKLTYAASNASPTSKIIAKLGQTGSVL